MSFDPSLSGITASNFLDYTVKISKDADASIILEKKGSSMEGREVTSTSSSLIVDPILVKSILELKIAAYPEDKLSKFCLEIINKQTKHIEEIAKQAMDTITVSPPKSRPEAASGQTTDVPEAPYALLRLEDDVDHALPVEASSDTSRTAVPDAVSAKKIGVSAPPPPLERAGDAPHKPLSLPSSVSLATTSSSTSRPIDMARGIIRAPKTEEEVFRILSTDGKIDFEDLNRSSANFRAKLALILGTATKFDGKIKVTNVPRNPNKPADGFSSLTLTVKPVPILRPDGKIDTQLQGHAAYKEELSKKSAEMHYRFDLSDDKRSIPPFEIDEEMGEDLSRQIYESILADQKPSISFRVSADGEIGEIISIQADTHPEALLGNALMTTTDRLLKFLAPSHIFLDDQAKIEPASKVGAGYNLRLFRYFAEADKKSWYTDSYDFRPFKIEGGRVETIADVTPERIAPIKNMRLEALLTLIQDASYVTNANPVIAKQAKSMRDKLAITLTKLLTNPDYRDKNIGEIAKILANQIRAGKDIHAELYNILDGTILVLGKYYEGTNPVKLAFKRNAELVRIDIFLQKSYA